MTAIRSKEALEKERIRRDYEQMRLQLEEISKEENQSKAAGKVGCLRFSQIINVKQLST